MQYFNGLIDMGNRLVGDKASCYIVAEIGVNFNGNLELAKKTIKAAAKCGVDAVKFQTFDADEFIGNKKLNYEYLDSSGKLKVESQYEMFKRLSLPKEWHFILKNYANKFNLDFFSSVADKRAVDLLAEVGVPFLKLSSEDLINIDLIEYASSKMIPLIMSTGMADEFEIDNAVNIVKKTGNKNLILLHCTSKYPAPLEECNLNRITTLAKRYCLPVGFSDHTLGNESAFLSIALKSCVIEKHFTLSNLLEGPDHRMSINPSGMKKFVQNIRRAEKILGSDTLIYNDAEEICRKDFRRSIVAARDIEVGEVINNSMINYKRPGSGLKPYERNLILGFMANKNIKKDENILLEDVNR